MPTRAPVPCPTCHQLGDCTHRGSARRHRSSSTWTQWSRDLIAEHVTTHGWWCPGWPPLDHEPHHTTDLTVHHLDRLATTSVDTGRHVVLCRSINSAIG